MSLFSRFGHSPSKEISIKFEAMPLLGLILRLRRPSLIKCVSLYLRIKDAKYKKSTADSKINSASSDCLATSYSPRTLRSKYHRRWRA